MNREEIQSMRRSYSERELAPPQDPIAAFKGWLKEAAELPSIIEANAMVLSTLGADENIQSRSVLLKDVTEAGFTFFTNYNSRKAQAIEIKGKALRDNPNVIELNKIEKWDGVLPQYMTGPVPFVNFQK